MILLRSEKEVNNYGYGSQINSTLYNAAFK